MSASLVGSEMCIRDSREPPFLWTLSCGPFVSFQQAPAEGGVNTRGPAPAEGGSGGQDITIEYGRQNSTI
eukprot:13799972-Alexandrium_andersonii.AAC.1